MKMRRSVLLVAVCLLVVMSISVVAFAATSKVFRRGVLDGYDYVCKGNISGSVATSTFSATAVESLPHHPEWDCSSYVWMLVRDKDGNVLATIGEYGGTYARPTYTARETIRYTYSTFEFMEENLGAYILSQ